METVILVSVLSTLGVVAVITSVVVAFIKLRGKVDVIDFRNEMKSFHDYLDHIERERRHSLDEVHLRISKHDDEQRRDLSETATNIYRHIDSRCDKLDSKIKNKD